MIGATGSGDSCVPDSLHRNSILLEASFDSPVVLSVAEFVLVPLLAEDGVIALIATLCTFAIERRA